VHLHRNAPGQLAVTIQFQPGPCRVTDGSMRPYNTARPHQGIARHVPDDEHDRPRATLTDVNTQQIRRKPVLNGLINEYTHAA